MASLYPPERGTGNRKDPMKICLYNDVAFKWTFGRQERTGPLISLLNAVMGHGSPGTVFREIRVLNPFDISKYADDKMGILDLRVKEAASGVWADVEMQVAYQEFYPERSMYYLAGLYRDQLSAGEDYHELRPCHGIHFLMSDLLEDEPDNWHNTYRMTNVRSHNSLSGHWSLHYLELGKFRKAVEEGDVSQGELEQWCGFLSEPHDPSETLGETFDDNEGIKEVHEMLGEFTQDERLREQYRLHEAWLRDQRYMEWQRREYRERLRTEVRLRQAEAKLRQTEASRRKKAEAERKKADAERKKAEAERKKADAERKKTEAESEKREDRSVLALREAGYSDERISEMLGISEDKVRSVRGE